MKYVKKRICGALILFFLLSLVLTLSAFAEPQADIRLVLNIPAYTLYVYRGDEVYREYPVGVGHPQYQTPLGNHRIISKIINPTWIPPERYNVGHPVPPGPDNPLGPRWCGYLASGYGLHGTTNPRSIGWASTGGCIRLFNRDILELFDLVRIGTPLDVIYETQLERMDPATRKPYLEVLPDIYGRGVNAAEAVWQRLTELGIESIHSKEELAELLASQTEPLKLGSGQIIEVNDEFFSTGGAVIEGRPYVPISPLALSFWSVMTWLRDGQMLVDGTPVEGIKLDHMFYVPLDELNRYYPGIKVVWDKDEKRIRIYRVVLFSGHSKIEDITAETVFHKDKVYFPLRLVAEAVGRTVNWDSVNRTVSVDGRLVRGWFANGLSHVTAAQLSHALDMDVEFSPHKGRLTLRPIGQEEGRK